MISLTLLFTISVCIAITLIFLGVNIPIALLLAMLLYSVPTLGKDLIPTVFSSFNMNMLNTVLSLMFALLLANLFKSKAISDQLVSSFQSIGIRIATVAIPAIIGLLPMPAGAYISATMVEPIYRKLGLDREKSTYINFWLRHIWLAVWPLYQGIILASGILKKTSIEIISWTWPIALASLIAGIIVVSLIVPKETGEEGCRKNFRGLIHIWPFLLVALLTFSGLQLVFLSVLITIVIFVIIYRVSFRELMTSLRKSIDYSLIGLVVVSLVFGDVLAITGLSNQLVGYLMGDYKYVLMPLVPLFIVLATGFEFTFVVLTFPALQPLLSGPGLTLAYLGGYLGAMLSPSHACLVMSAKYFNASLPRVYKYLIPSAALTAIITVLFIFAANHVFMV